MSFSKFIQPHNYYQECFHHPNRSFVPVYSQSLCSLLWLQATTDLTYGFAFSKDFI